MSALAISRKSRNVLAGSQAHSAFCGTHDLCRDSTEAGSNLLKLSVTDGFFWRSEIPSATVIGPLSDPRPLPHRPLPYKDSASVDLQRLYAKPSPTISHSS